MTALDLHLQLLQARLDLAWLHLQLLALHAAVAAAQVATWIYTNPLQTIAAACGLVGAALLATNTRCAALGWLAFLASNAAWIAFSLREGVPGLLIQQIGFTATSLVGVWIWIVKPRLTP